MEGTSEKPLHKQRSVEFGGSFKNKVYPLPDDQSKHGSKPTKKDSQLSLGLHEDTSVRSGGGNWKKGKERRKSAFAASAEVRFRHVHVSQHVGVKIQI